MRTSLLRLAFCLALILLSHPAGAAISPPKMTTLPGASVQLDPTRKTISRIEGKNLLQSLPSLAARVQRDPAAVAIEFVQAHRELFRLRQPARELKLKAVQADELGFRHVRLTQTFRGLEVIQSELIFHFNRENALYLINGSYLATPANVQTRPSLSAAAAARAVAVELKAKTANSPAVLKIWPSPGGFGVLAYEVAASVGPDQAWQVFVDAHTGKILDRISTIHTTSGLPFRRGEE